MSDERTPLSERFPPIDYDTWREAAERDLKGVPFDKLVSRTRDGIVVEPLYTSDHPQRRGAPDRVPGRPPFTRGCLAARASDEPWHVATALRAGDPAQAADLASYDARHGASAFRLVLDDAARGALVPHEDAAAAGRGGVCVWNADALDTALAGEGCERAAVVVDGGLAGAVVGAALATRGTRPVVAGVDPLGTLARDGALPVSLDRAFAMMADIVAWSGERDLLPVTVSGIPYAEGGAPAALELGLVLATGVEYLRRLEMSGVDPDAAAPRMVLELGLGRDMFVDLAKVRAARLTWERVTSACGVADERRGARVWARALASTKTRRDPWVNVLRGTVEGFVAAVGGAEGVEVAAFDARLGRSNELGRRLAAHTQVMLREESHLGHVVDPAGGSWYVEELTDALAERAWAVLREIEAGGGMAALLAGGDVCARVREAAEATARDVAKRKEPITGVSSYPHIGEERVSRPDLDAPLPSAVRDASEAAPSTSPRIDALRQALEGGARDGSATAAAVAAFAEGVPLARILRAFDDGGGAARAPRVEPFPLASGFEALRDRSDAILDRDGRRPRAFLANIGPIPQHRARAEFSKNFLEAGGIETLTNDGFADATSAADAFASSGATIAVIASSDEAYPEAVPELAPALRRAGARRLLLAGRPGEHENAYREAGVDTFIFLGSDVLSILESLYEDQEAQR